MDKSEAWPQSGQVSWVSGLLVGQARARDLILCGSYLASPDNFVFAFVFCK